jgi:hypothetical protein
LFRQVLRNLSLASRYTVDYLLLIHIAGEQAVITAVKTASCVLEVRFNLWQLLVLYLSIPQYFIKAIFVNSSNDIYQQCQH